MRARLWTAVASMALCAGCGSDGSPTAPDAPDAPARVAAASRTASALVKSVDVFGIPIRATAAVPDEKLLHAARVMAEYLDDDEDGTPDDPLVVGAMVAASAYMVMFADEADEQALSGELPPGSGQNLYARETHPEGSSAGAFDATLEEVLHLISHAGLASAYPDAFAETGTSRLTAAMDVARGGHFETIPASYPEGAWYRYADPTCSYDCMATEYFYWSLTSILGGQQHPGRLEEIENEWSLNTREKVEATDTAIFALLTDPLYRLPTRLPDGVYTAVTLAIQQ